MSRDLKFENILFQSKRENAQIQVLDFGLSKRFLPGAPKTMTGEFCLRRSAL